MNALDYLALGYTDGLKGNFPKYTHESYKKGYEKGKEKKETREGK